MIIIWNLQFDGKDKLFDLVLNNICTKNLKHRSFTFLGKKKFQIILCLFQAITSFYFFSLECNHHLCIITSAQWHATDAVYRMHIVLLDVSSGRISQDLIKRSLWKLEHLRPNIFELWIFESFFDMISK